MKRNAIHITALILGTALLYSPIMVFAQTAGNSDTGSNSDNSSSVNIDISNTITDTNTSDTTNNVDINASTGSNSASGNTGDGRVTSGDVDMETTAETIAGQSAMVTPMVTTIPQVDVSNSQTGANSTNVTSADINISDTHTRTSVANTVNDINISASTGGNMADNNTGDGTVRSGDIRGVVKISNISNPGPAPTPGGPGGGGPGGGGPGGGGPGGGGPGGGAQPPPGPTPGAGGAPDGEVVTVTVTAPVVLAAVSPSPSRRAISVTAVRADGVGGAPLERMDRAEMFPAGANWINALILAFVASTVIQILAARSGKAA